MKLGVTVPTTFLFTAGKQTLIQKALEIPTTAFTAWSHFFLIIIILSWSYYDDRDLMQTNLNTLLACGGLTCQLLSGFMNWFPSAVEWKLCLSASKRIWAKGASTQLNVGTTFVFGKRPRPPAGGPHCLHGRMRKGHEPSGSFWVHMHPGKVRSPSIRPANRLLIHQRIWRF